MAKRTKSRSPSRSPRCLRPDAHTVRQDPTYVYRRGSSEGSEDEETEEETEEGSRETALRRSYVRAKRQNKPLRRTANPSDLSVQELKRLLGEKTEEKRSATNIIAKGGDIATERFQIPRTDIAAKRLLFPTWLEEFCELSRFGRWTRHNHL
ncbi:hypothetical protein HBI81_244080 [Parastagonospora nodorum]|nr:hypothetical protein HBI73_239580 [Parastagonospora nodorum]KAH5707312.1 hypothetical protein HBI18_250130 [Parastagonospora nodorum]KAH6511173.1 hypothetical protein HBI81_244080 [Parastagonospora nodorum]